MSQKILLARWWLPFCHDDIIKWKHFPRYWPFVQGIHWSPVNSPHKGQWLRALMFSLICARASVWVNIRDAGDLRHHRAHYDCCCNVLSLTHCSLGYVAVVSKCNFQTKLGDWYLEYSSEYNLRMNAQVSVNTGSGNGLVPSGNKPLPEPMLTQIYVTIWHHQATMS